MKYTMYYCSGGFVYEHRTREVYFSILYVLYHIISGPCVVMAMLMTKRELLNIGIQHGD